MTFQWIDAKGVVIDNNDAEWNMTVNITERTDIQSLPARMDFTMDQRLGVADTFLPSTLRVMDAQRRSNLSTSQQNIQASQDPRLSNTAIYT